MQWGIGAASRSDLQTIAIPLQQGPGISPTDVEFEKLQMCIALPLTT